MTTTLEDMAPPSTTSAASRLRATMAAVRISFTSFGTRKTLTTEQKAQAADTFGAEQSFLSSGKKLLDANHPAFKAVSSVTVCPEPIQKPRVVKPMPETKTETNNSPIDQVVALRLSLRDSLVKTNDLLRSLKRERRQSRLVASTLASLKQLQKSA